MRVLSRDNQWLRGGIKAPRLSGINRVKSRCSWSIQELRVDERIALSSHMVPLIKKKKNYWDISITPGTYTFDGGKRWSSGYNPHDHMQNEQTACWADLVKLEFWSGTFLLRGIRGNCWERRRRRFDGESWGKVERNGSEKGDRLAYICLHWLNDWRRRWLN